MSAQVAEIVARTDLIPTDSNLSLSAALLLVLSQLLYLPILQIIVKEAYMASLIKVFGTNWKTNAAAAIVFVLSCPAFVAALANWAHRQPADWRGALVGIVIASGLAAAKDSSTHSTTTEVEAASDKAQE
jgi:hypothetical protein